MTKEEKLYREAMGEDALERQKKLARDTCSQCGARLPNHNQLCRAKSRLRA